MLELSKAKTAALQSYCCLVSALQSTSLLYLLSVLMLVTLVLLSTLPICVRWYLMLLLTLLSLQLQLVPLSVHITIANYSILFINLCATTGSGSSSSSSKQDAFREKELLKEISRLHADLASRGAQVTQITGKLVY
jgi:hypothetical protein